MAFMDEYKAHVAERAAQGIPPFPLTKEQVTDLVALISATSSKNGELVEMLAERVNPGVDDGAYVKAAFLHQVVQGEVKAFLSDNSDINSDDHKKAAIKILGKMVGGYNVKPLIDALSNDAIANEAAHELKHNLLVYDAFNDIVDLSKTNSYAKEVLQSWADAEWFTAKKPLAEKFSVVVFKFPGETNTDDLSPASAAFTRSDIPLHATTMLSAKMPEGIAKIAELKEKGMQIAYVGDVVGTGSSRKSAANSVQWHMGDDIPGIPNKRTGGVVIGSIIAPIFFATCEDSGALPIEADVSSMETGDVLDIDTKAGTITKKGAVIANFTLRPNTIEDEVRAGGRIPLIIGRGLSARARTALGMAPATIFATPIQPADTGKGYTLAQKMVGKACGMEGVRPGMYCEPITSTVGSQDTTGPMTRDEIKELSALGFSADFVLQSFCHTAAYPKPSDVKLHATLPAFISSRSGLALRPADGVIHSWLNRMLLPDTVGTGGGSHTRFPIGISFPAGSGLVAFAAATGVMPLDMPESVLVRFKGQMQPGVTLLALVHATPYAAIQRGEL